MDRLQYIVLTIYMLICIVTLTTLLVMVFK